MDRPSDTTSLEKAASIFHRSHQLPIVPLLGVGICVYPPPPPPLLVRTLVLILFKFVLSITTAMSSYVHLLCCVLKKKMFWCSHPSPLAMIPEPWRLGGSGGCDMSVPFKAGHCTVSYSPHVGHLWVSVLTIIMLSKEILKAFPL